MESDLGKRFGKESDNLVKLLYLFIGCFLSLLKHPGKILQRFITAPAEPPVPETNLGWLSAPAPCPKP